MDIFRQYQFPQRFARTRNGNLSVLIVSIEFFRVSMCFRLFVLILTILTFSERTTTRAFAIYDESGGSKQIRETHCKYLGDRKFD